MKLLLALLLLFPWQALAAACPGYTGQARGAFRDSCIVLCDGADSTCAEVDLPDDVDGRGVPAFFTVSIEKSTTCGGSMTVLPIGRAISTTGVAHSLGNGFLLTVAGTSSKDYDVSHKFVDVTVAGGGACVDLEVFLVLWYPL